jgi:Spy/CpxP family protein refolding chaperone
MSAFTRKWLAGLLAVALAAGASSWWIARRAGDIAGRARPCDALSPTPDLGLTAEQAARVSALEKAYRARVEELCAKHCAARARIARLLAEGKPPKRQLLSAAKEAGEAYSDLEEATVRHVLEVGEALTPEQRARYHASMSGCLGAQCPRAGPMSRPAVAP